MGDRRLLEGDYDVLERVAEGRTLFVNVFRLAFLKGQGYVDSTAMPTHTAWSLTDSGREMLEAEEMRRNDDA